MKFAIATLLFVLGLVFMALSAEVSSAPDERDRMGITVPRLPDFQPPAMEKLRLAVEAVIAPAPPDYIFPAQTLGPVRRCDFSWPRCADTNVAVYVLQCTTRMDRPFATIASVSGTNISLLRTNWGEFFRVLSVNPDGLTTEGNYEF